MTSLDLIIQSSGHYVLATVRFVDSSLPKGNFDRKGFKENGHLGNVDLSMLTS